MTQSDRQADKAVAAIRSAGMPMTASELGAQGVSRTALRRLEAAGVLERSARGVYRLSDAPFEERSGWAAVALRHPRAVFCLVSAATYHSITQDMPTSLQVAVPHGDASPQSNDIGPRVEVVRWRDPAFFEIGVETVEIDGVPVKVTSPERTVVDLFRHSTLNGRTLVTEETYFDALHRLLDPVARVGEIGKLTKVARELKVNDRMRPTLRAANYAISTGYGA